MARYLILYKADPAAMAAMPEPTPEQIEEMNSAWNGWAERTGAGVIDFGAPTSAKSEAAGPRIGGYSNLEFDTEDALNESLAAHPHRAMGGTIDVFELQPIPGM